jgi:hypothetical protein
MQGGVFRWTCGSALIVALIVFWHIACAESLVAQPGLWKIDAMAGTPGLPLLQCVVADDLKDPQKIAMVFGHPFHPMKNGADARYHALEQPSYETCQYSDVKQFSDSLALNYQCKGAFALAEEGSLKFDSPTHYSGVFTVGRDGTAAARSTSPRISVEGSRVGGCSEVAASRPNLGYVVDPVTGKEHLADLSVPDPDVVAADAAQNDLQAHLTPCEIETYQVLNVGIDLSGTVAKLYVQLSPSVKQLDVNHVCIPATYEGVPIVQSFVTTSPLN